MSLDASNFEHSLVKKGEKIMEKDIYLNKRIMNFIRYSLGISMVAVCVMDLMMGNKLNSMYILINLAVLYFIND